MSATQPRPTSNLQTQDTDVEHDADGLRAMRRLLGALASAVIRKPGRTAADLRALRWMTGFVANLERHHRARHLRAASGPTRPAALAPRRRRARRKVPDPPGDEPEPRNTKGRAPWQATGPP
ncbi:hypothetical protein J5Y09_06740 [Roseomonas sp. PWR1]|uniref:Uncharacterized protein n=1 Tax=Roseomonas nitratireducens TaxID=2820810 RepID=A0ABS4AQF7_9PROT|nr:hypothetical protein [Neoroseomonas nitratireducens]MBP0463600.1 hypothetical protein [Neoroseomonas nitratireducens]